MLDLTHPGRLCWALHTREVKAGYNTPERLKPGITHPGRLEGRYTTLREASREVYPIQEG